MERSSVETRKDGGTAANLDCICPLITQVQGLFLICNVFVDGVIDQFLYVAIFIRRAKLHN